MQAGWRIGSVFGIPLWVHPSWLAIVALVTVSNALDWGMTHPQWSASLTWPLGLVSAILLFASVLLHELGHSLVAQAQGIQVTSITLFLFGGIAAISRESRTPWQAFQVAIAGPLVSVTLAIGLQGLLQVLPPDSPGWLLAQDLVRINGVVAMFNLIPGLPLDGGQVFKAVLWQWTGNPFLAVRWAARSGQVLGWGAVLGGAGWVLGWGETTGVWICLLGWFGIRNAKQYIQLALLQETLATIPISAAMSQDFQRLEASMTLRQFADRSLLSPAVGLSIVAQPTGISAGLSAGLSADLSADLSTGISAGMSAGMSAGLSTGISAGMSAGILGDCGTVSLTDIQTTERSAWETTLLAEVAHPFRESLDETDSLALAVQALENTGLARLPVLQTAGLQSLAGGAEAVANGQDQTSGLQRVVGVIDRGDLVQAVAQVLKLSLSPEQLAQVKRDQVYPPGLQLGAIAQAMGDSRDSRDSQPVLTPSSPSQSASKLQGANQPVPPPETTLLASGVGSQNRDPDSP